MSLKSVFQEALLRKLGQVFSSGSTFTRIQHAIEMAEDPNLSGAEKKERAIEYIKAFGIEISGFVLNLLVEVAVAILRIRMEDKNEGIK